MKLLPVYFGERLHGRIFSIMVWKRQTWLKGIQLGEIDHLFNNNEPRASYIKFSGPTLGGDDVTVTLLWDASNCITISLLSKIEAGRGEARSMLFSEVLNDLHPLSSIEVLTALHNISMKCSPEEFKLSDVLEFHPTLEDTTADRFTLRSSSRYTSACVYITWKAVDYMYFCRSCS